jgi:hypothetical protein
VVDTSHMVGARISTLRLSQVDRLRRQFIHLLIVLVLVSSGRARNLARFRAAYNFVVLKDDKYQILKYKPAHVAVWQIKRFSRLGYSRFEWRDVVYKKISFTW